VSAFAVLVLVVLLACVGTHVALWAFVAKRGPMWRGALAALVPALVPIWGWELGHKRLALGWTAAVLAFGACVAVA
jgi:hypothetical protein